ncbi:unnamed protein product [Strongylus vulgaris]|uniref:Peptidase M13 C-terminal domain-containing protein n=1 Tax=Strongylus vulgaris TaxID=40348 RepID=A0A3P7IXZ4_STRVU|nr:unnamed protein product [Strongylus vulgaris]
MTVILSLFLAQVNLTALGLGRLGTYDQAQVDVNKQIVASLNAVDVTDEKWSVTERITKAALDACVINSNIASSLDNSKQIYDDLTNWFGGVPFLGGQLNQTAASIWGTVGFIEQTHALGTLLSSWVSVDYKNVSQNALYISQVVISQPSYFAWLNAIFAGNTVDQNIIVNYIIAQLLFDDSGFLGGYVYVKAQANRNDVVKDVSHQTDLVISNFQEMIGTLDWMTPDSKAAAKFKSDNIYKNYGWPTELFGDFVNFTNVDNYHIPDYQPILDAYKKNKTDYYTISNILKTGLENREAFRLLTEKADRSNFLQSPAMVNAWYQPERNSITFPYAIWNPPYYNLYYPQAYNYAGQGGTGGHELTHGFDDEDFLTFIGLLIFDDRLPGLEQFTPNQIFWITYGYSWCMKQSDNNLVNQLLTNPHAPGSCRTNQVMQDIPSFGKDFGCKQGSPMYPSPDQRCKVWVGY